MDLPQPPQDNDLRNIIDKLAQFVARNGPEFEQMTKSKQKNNPKFSFLYGGEYFNYYQYKVTTEQAILKQHSGRQDSCNFLNQGGYSGDSWTHSEGNSVTTGQGQTTSSAAPNVPAAGSPALTVIALTAQQATLHEQIKQSQSNLNAQHAVLIQQQQTQMEETIANAQSEMIQRLATECNISLADFDNILQPIIESCTKDSISAGKGWILNHATSHEAGAVISKYLLKKLTTPGSTFTQKLHIIYLVNDVLHHCARKNADNLMRNLESVVIPMFCKTSIAITEDQEVKLNKLLKLWESKTNYFDTSIIQKMKNPTTSYQEYQANLIAQYANLITPLTQQTKTTFENYQQQHQVFVAHSLQQIQQLELQKQLLTNQMNTTNQQMEGEQNNLLQATIPPKSTFGQQSSFVETKFNQQAQQIINNSSNSIDREQQSFPNVNKPLFPINESDSNYGSSNGSQDDDKKSYNYDNYQSINNSNENSSDALPALPPINLSQPPPGFFNDGLPRFENGLPDLSKPPPGFSNIPDVSQEDLMPSVPYFELPAGLIVPLIMLEDCDYKPLDPDAIRLPPPAPPSERLLAAVKAFYAKPNHTRPQDSEGWEKLGLYEYYKAKNAVRKQKEEDVKNGIREKSRSPTPIKYDYQILKSPPTRRYRSKSRSPSPRRSRSRSPPAVRISPERGRNRSSRNLRRSPSPCSPPPSFMIPSMGNLNDTSELDSSNKGHQMLKKMGWGQGGLGASGQGIAAPINAGIVRDRQDQYKGVGVNLNDPYENFRKNKGAAFITRMKERALERS